MIVARRVAAAAVAGVVLLGGPAWAQEDPCAPGPDGSVPEMCQSGPAPEPQTEPAPEETVDPCEGARPGEPGAVGEGEGVAEGQPHPDARSEPAPEGEPVEEGAVEPEPAPEDEPRPEPDAATSDAPADEDGTVATPAPGTVDDDGVVCAYAGLPVSAPDTAAGGQESAPVLESASGRDATTAAGQLPRTGLYEKVVALAAVGSGLLIIGAGAAAAGRRRARRA